MKFRIKIKASNSYFFRWAFANTASYCKRKNCKVFDTRAAAEEELKKEPLASYAEIEEDSE